MSTPDDPRAAAAWRTLARRLHDADITTDDVALRVESVAEAAQLPPNARFDAIAILSAVRDAMRQFDES